MEYKKATIHDLEDLVSSRLQVLKTVFSLSEDTDMSEVKSATEEYYKWAVESKEHTAILVYDNDKVIAAGDICYYKVMPMEYDTSGKKAYIMNIYTDEKYRGNGIAKKVVKLLLEDAKANGVHSVSLSTTEMGRGVYESCGFELVDDVMEITL